ncbi:hypothetical protein ACOSQ3_024536 [Xanthoceras sorbifolium]
MSKNFPTVLGTDELNAYLNKYHLELNKYHLELDPQLDALVGSVATFGRSRRTRRTMFLKYDLGEILDDKMKFSSVLWWNEQRLWMIKSITAYIYGILDAILKYFGMRHPSFLPADNAANEIIPNRNDMANDNARIPPSVFLCMVSMALRFGLK